jgi:hypothetical protein
LSNKNNEVIALGHPGGRCRNCERMTDKIEVCAILLNDAAIERSQGNPELASADFESLCNVMWPDDNDMKRDGLTREEFRLALQSAWMKMATPKFDQ